jgi:hypothetical protein
MTGDTTRRGYGTRHQALRKKLKPRVEAGAVTCWRCSQRILPGQPWDLGHHDTNRTLYMGPEHRRCNRSKREPVQTERPRALSFFDTK